MDLLVALYLGAAEHRFPPKKTGEKWIIWTLNQNLANTLFGEGSFFWESNRSGIAFDNIFSRTMRNCLSHCRHDRIMGKVESLESDGPSFSHRHRPTSDARERRKTASAAMSVESPKSMRATYCGQSVKFLTSPAPSDLFHGFSFVDWATAMWRPDLTGLHPQMDPLPSPISFFGRLGI